jgi:predicted amidohydrolase YtcJ
MNRRDLWRWASATAISAYGGRLSRASDLAIPPGIKERIAPGGDIAVVNAKVWTMDPLRPRAQAVLVRGGRIVLVGDNDTVRARAQGARRFDAHGRSVVPGFIDTHTHFELACCYYGGLQLDIHTPPVESLAQVFDRLRERVVHTAHGRWIVARGTYSFDELVRERRFPTRQELDAISERHPIVVMAGLHRVMMNTLAFKTVGLWDPLTAANLRWRDGRLRIGTDVARDSEGYPTGMATEIIDLLPQDMFTLEEKRRAIREQAVPHFVAKGLTSLTTLPFCHTDVVIDQRLQAEDALPLRLRCYYTVPLIVPLESLLDIGLQPGAGDDMFRHGGIKVFVSGAGVDAHGNSVSDMKFTQDELDELVWRAHSAGQQILMHEEGQESLTRALIAVEKSQIRHPSALRHRIEHDWYVDNVDTMARLRRLGMRMTITLPQYKFARDANSTDISPRYATLIREGVEPAAISDSTGTVPTFSPLTGIASIVAPLSEGGSSPPGEAPSVEDAFRMWTIWAARAQFEEADKGSIEVGKLGDLAVLNDDLDRVTGGALFDMSVEATILGGRVVFERTASR